MKRAPMHAAEQAWRDELAEHLYLAGDIDHVEGQAHNQLGRAAARLLHRYDTLLAKYTDEVRRHNLLMRDSTNYEQRLKEQLAQGRAISTKRRR